MFFQDGSSAHDLLYPISGIPKKLGVVGRAPGWDPEDLEESPFPLISGYVTLGTVHSPLCVSKSSPVRSHYFTGLPEDYSDNIWVGYL